MAGVMYQGYAYLQAYGRPPYCPTSSFAFNHYDKKCQQLALQNTASVAPQDLEQQIQQQYAHLPLRATATPLDGQPSHVAPAQTTPVSTSSAAVCSSPAVPPHYQGQGQPGSGLIISSKQKNKDGGEHPDARYVSANCVVLTYFNGDLTAAIDEHFSRALNVTFSRGSKEHCPMAQRNFPASFWNSHYYPAVGSYAAPGTSVSLPHDAFYHDYSGFHGLHQPPDPWAYNFPGQYSHHRPMTDFTYMPSSSRYSHNYSSLLMGRARLPQCVVGKPDPWSGSSSRLHDDLPLEHATTAYGHHFSSVSGFDCGSATQETGKDLYWF